MPTVPDRVKTLPNPTLDCHVCRSARHVVKRYDRRQSLDGEVYGCRRCGLSFFVPAAERVAQSEDYWRGDANLAVYSNLDVIRELQEKYAFYFDILRKRPLRGCRLLDVGAGTGISMRLARTLGFEASGIDVSGKAAQYARQAYNLDVQVGCLEESCFEPLSFDVITCWDVIEHVQDPRLLLAKTHELLAPRGILVLETPDEGALLRKAVRVVNKVTCGKVNFLNGVYYPDHRWYFSRKSLRSLLNEVGYREMGFYRDGTMVEKAKGKRRAYGDHAGILLETLGFLVLKSMRTIPLLGNKIVVLATKG